MTRAAALEKSFIVVSRVCENVSLECQQRLEMK